VRTVRRLREKCARDVDGEKVGRQEGRKARRSEVDERKREKRA
jgi:hypothetical protein